MKRDNTELFTKAPVLKAIMLLAIPTVISQLITVIYNMADTFFIGQLGDPNQVAAASLAMPVFMMLNAIANLFGIGGASLVSRSLGKGEREKARCAGAFSLWSAIAVAFIYGIAILIFKPVLLPAIGTNAGTYDFCYQYLFWTITIGAVPTVMSTTLSHLVRAEGYSAHASVGIALGGILNIFLDWLFIFVFGMNIIGAAIATMLSNVIAVCYFVALIIIKRRSLNISLDPRHYTIRQRIPREVMLVGLPSSILSLMAVLSNVVLNKLLGSYCNEAIAGIGIAKKIDFVVYAVGVGLAQGVLPLIAYNYSSGNIKRMKSAIKLTLLICLAMALVGVLSLFFLAEPLVRAFIDDALTVEYGSVFQKIISISVAFSAFSMVIITIFQACGKKLQPTVLSFLRKGCVDIPFMLLLNKLIGVYGIAWATPVADFIAMCVAFALFVPFWKEFNKFHNEIK